MRLAVHADSSIIASWVVQGEQQVRATFARGIAAVRAADGSACITVGSSAGHVHVFDGRYHARGMHDA